MQDQQVAARGLEHAPLQGVLEQLAGRGQVREQGAPGAELGFAGALHEDVEVGGEGGEEGEDGGEEGGVWWGRVVDFVVEDGVQEDFEGVRKVGEGEVGVREREGRGRVVLREIVSEERGEEELGLVGECLVVGLCEMWVEWSLL